ncbi:MAG: hypothetical protein WBY93_21690 [Candidatus Binatus sp.]
MRISKHHMGIGFEVWDGQRTWFWFVSDPHREGGTIGAAPTELEAVREARSSIEERSDSIILSGWERTLGNLERYLASFCDAAA